jgi:hypothetical protein
MADAPGPAKRARGISPLALASNPRIDRIVVPRCENEQLLRREKAPASAPQTAFMVYRDDPTTRLPGLLDKQMIKVR